MDTYKRGQIFILPYMIIWSKVRGDDLDLGVKDHGGSMGDLE